MKIAIVKLSALGDIIHAASVLEQIKKRLPNTQIDWIVEERFAPILEYNPHIDKIHKLNLKSIKNNFSYIFKEISKVKELKKESYDIVIDFQGLIKSAIVSKLISNHVVGYDKYSIREKQASFFYNEKVSIPYGEHTIKRYTFLASKALGIDIKKDDILAKNPYLFYSDSDLKKVTHLLKNDRKNIIFIIGSTWESRIYPKEQLINIANNLDANILIPYGNKDELESAKHIEKECKNVTVLPKLNLNQLKAVISKSNLLIGNDTGPTYIAWANNIPSITIFGPTPPIRIYETDINKIVKSPSKVNPYKLDKNDFSIKEIPYEKIILLAKELLKNNKS